jgi:serine protease Do
MRIFQTIYVSILISLFMFSTSASAISLTLGKPDSFAKLAEKVSPSVVNINTTKNTKNSTHPFSGVTPYFDQFFKDYNNRQKSGGKQKRTYNSLGTGFIISEDGKVITNYHVIKGADGIFITLHSGSKTEAKLLGVDKKLDLALLQIQKKGKYPAVTLGDSDKNRIGEWVLAVGNPFGLGQTVTAGIISAKGRVLGAGPYDDFIQTDASINPGNSGGPLFNLEGEVIGINSAIVSNGQGIGFAIPSNMAKQVLEQLISQGKVTRGWLGVSIKDLNEDEAKVYDVKQDEGVLVTDVVVNGPAYNAGLEPGDIITKINDEDVGDAHKMPSTVAGYRPGDEIVIGFLRSKNKLKSTATLGDLDSPNKSFVYPTHSTVNNTLKGQMGIAVRDLEEGDHKTNKGVLVTYVHPNSVSSKLGLARGDIILSLNEDKIASVKEFKKRLGKLDKGEIIKLEVLRVKTRLFFAFPK